MLGRVYAFLHFVSWPLHHCHCIFLSLPQVSFSVEQPRVIMVPGSVEQRGTHLHQALTGAAPFCRPVTHDGVALVLTAQLGCTAVDGADGAQQLRLRVSPAGEGNKAAEELVSADGMQLARVQLPDVKVGAWGRLGPT